MSELNVLACLKALQELKLQHRSVWINAYLILYPTGDGAVVLEDTLNDKHIAAVDFDAGDDLLEAVRRLAEKAKEVI